MIHYIEWLTAIIGTGFIGFCVLVLILIMLGEI